MFKLVRDNFCIIRHFFGLMHGDRKWVFVLFFGSALGHLASLAIPIFASNIVYEVTNGNADAAYWNIALLGLSDLVYCLSWYANNRGYSHNFPYAYRNLRERIVDKLFSYDIEFSDKISKGTVLNTISSDVSNLSEMYISVCETIVISVKVVVMVAVFMFTNVYIGIVVMLFEIAYLKAYDYCNINSTKYLHRQLRYRDKLTDNLSQILDGLSEIKTFNIYDKVKQMFYAIADKWAQQYRNKRRYVDARSGLVPLIIRMGKVLLYVALVYMTLHGHLEINVLLLLVTYFENIATNTRDLMSYSMQIRDWSTSIVRIDRLLNYRNGQKFDFGTLAKNDIAGRVKFDHVSFTYHTKNRGNVRDINFVAEPHSITALVGHSGSGKTTIANLLLRKYIVDKGNISIDGDDIYSFTDAVYATNVVGVDQMPFMFNLSIRRNLDLIDTNRERQEEVCRRVGIHDYIMSLPAGYNTVLNENATNFSGGQRQLLAIARALLSKAEVLVFDEVTSSLDPMLVETIKGIFNDLKIDHTVIIVTHKKDIMQVADKLIVLNHGHIVGQGNHQQLMANNQYYRDIQLGNDSSSPRRVVHQAEIVELPREDG